VSPGDVKVVPKLDGIFSLDLLPQNSHATPLY
jgi:hypothetical protein